MNLFVCNSCCYVFEADEMSDTCPSCRSRTVLGTTDSGKKFSFPAVRLASEIEAQAYENVKKDIYEEKVFLERVNGLSAYNLSDDEYHVALMLLFALKTTPNFYASHFLSDLLPTMKADLDEATARATVRDMYMNVKKSFTSQINRERREAGTNDTADVARCFPSDSASVTLLKFRQGELDALLKGPQNLGDIRRVNIEKVSAEPSAEYVRFLAEWYNSII